MPSTPSTIRSDLEIARDASLRPIVEIARTLGLEPDDLDLYGRFKAKLPGTVRERLHPRPDGKLVLVTAISPTPAGEGKTTTTIGLGDALARLGQRTVIALREPSLGPAFGVKGGATGGGQAQVAPMEDINLHFTGDFHAVTAANNLLAAMIDNHLHQGNVLGLDPRRITFQRALDMNDRALRNVVLGLGGKAQGVPREAGFCITPASEVMAILCLASDLHDLRERCGNIIVGHTFDDRPVRARELDAHGAMAVLLREAIHPNLVQTLEGTPALVHGGPFANIAHGCNTLIATRTALKLGDVVVTEAGFGADLGAEKFLDIKCRVGGLTPSVVVLVTTIRSLKMHGGVARGDLAAENLPALERGADNLRRHLHVVTEVFGLPCVVALNPFPGDTPAEIAALETIVTREGGQMVRSEVHARGGAGGEELARAVLAKLESPTSFRFVYETDDPLATKIERIATRVYGARGVTFSPAASRELARLAATELASAPVCIAKTAYSFSHDPGLLGAPTGWELPIREIRPVAGAGFVLAIAGDIMTMPGLPARPAAGSIDLDADGLVTGLF